MLEIGLPFAFVLLLWWASTGAILYLNGLPRRTHGWSLGSATVLLALALLALVVTRDDTRATGAYLAFVAALAVWGWAELAFLLGRVTGPRREACPPQAGGWRRAWLGLQTVLYHEIALIVLGAAVLLAVGDGPNRSGLWTFAALWALRLSAKLNLLLGVRNVGEAFLPPQLAYLASYFRRRAMNPLLPLSLALSAVATALVWQAALAGATAAHDAPALALLGSLLALGLLEHVFLALPLPTHRLWQWSLRSRPNTLAAGEPSRRDALAPNSEPCAQKDSRTQHLPALSP